MVVLNCFYGKEEARDNNDEFLVESDGSGDDYFLETENNDVVQAIGFLCSRGIHFVVSTAYTFRISFIQLSILSVTSFLPMILN